MPRLIVAFETLRRFGGLMLDALLPPRCLACGTITGDQGGLCPSCWSGLSFIAAPFCPRCGASAVFALSADAGAASDESGGAQPECPECAVRPPVFARARAALVYDDASRPLVLAFKHADRLDAAGAFAAWMLRAGGDLLRDADVLAPVPLHRRRLFSRRFNQSAALASALGKLAGRPTAVDALIRRRATASQGRMGRGERGRNVRGAFAVPASRAGAVQGKRVLLIDDVMTTGATVSECAAALLNAGAAAVDVLTLARAESRLNRR